MISLRHSIVRAMWRILNCCAFVCLVAKISNCLIQDRALRATYLRILARVPPRLARTTCWLAAITSDATGTTRLTCDYSKLACLRHAGWGCHFRKSIERMSRNPDLPRGGIAGKANATRGNLGWIQCSDWMEAKLLGPIRAPPPRRTRLELRSKNGEVSAGCADG